MVVVVCVALFVPVLSFLVILAVITVDIVVAVVVSFGPRKLNLKLVGGRGCAKSFSCQTQHRLS